MPVDDITLQTLEHIEEAASQALSQPAEPEGSEAVRESQPEPSGAGTPLEELGSYAGEQINSEVIFAREGLNLTQKRPMTPQYARGLAEAARFYRRALEGRVSMRQVQEVMMSSEFSVLLGDTLDRVLLAKYATYAPMYRQFLRGRTVRDFRAVGSVRRNTGGRLSPVPEGGDYQQEGLTEESFTYAVKKYGKATSPGR